jgi:fluoroquinolone transport system permease protein
MKTFVALLRHEFILLARQNVIGISVATVIIYAGAVYLLPRSYHNAWLPALLMSEIVTMGVLFIAAMIFIELRQQTAQAFAVTPVSTGRWIMAKVVALTVLSTVAAQALLLVADGFPNNLLVTVAVILSALLYNQIGLVLAIWTGNIRDFFLPLSAVMGLLALSIYGHLGVADSPLFWLVPSYPAMVLIASGVNEVSIGVLGMALGLLLAWNLLAFWLCRHVFHARVCARFGH